MSTPDERLKSFFVSLAHLGWGAKKWPEVQPLPEGFESIKEFRGGSWFPLSLPTNSTLLIFAFPGELLDFEGCFRHFEDLAPFQRVLLDAAKQAKLSGRFMLVFDERKASIIDRESEFVLAHASTRREWEENLLPYFDFQSINIGGLLNHPQKSARRAGQELAQWSSFWGAEIGSEVSTSKTVMNRFFETLHLSRLADEGNQQEKSYFLISRQKGSKKPVQLLESLFSTQYNHQNFLQMAGIETSLQLARQSKRLADCLQSYGRLAHGKLRSDVFAEAYAEQDFKDLSYKAFLRQELPVQAEAAENNPNQLQYPVVFNADQFGYVLMLQAFDQRVELVRKDALERKAALARGERPGMQLDLLSNESEEIAPENAVFAVLKSHFFVETAESKRFSLIRLLLLARACEWNNRLKATNLLYPAVKIQLTSPPQLNARFLVPHAGAQN